MKSRLIRASLTVAAAVSLLALTSVAALAAHEVKSTLTVPVGLTPNDLHIIYTGTGGTIANVTVTPAGATNVSGGGNTVDVVWGGKLAPGTVVTIKFDVDHGTIGVDSGRWTNDGVDIGSPITPGQVYLSTTDPADVPGASPLVLALVSLLIAGTGVMMLRRRAIA